MIVLSGLDMIWQKIPASGSTVAELGVTKSRNYKILSSNGQGIIE